jgi:hypothetical protein
MFVIFCAEPADTQEYFALKDKLVYLGSMTVLLPAWVGISNITLALVFNSRVATAVAGKVCVDDSI